MVISSAKNDHFYTQLPVNRIALSALLLKDILFNDVPADWHIIITDIKNSTRAVLGGDHQNVNLIATGSIVSVLNIAFGMKVGVPFFFGGDGATFLVPPVILEKVMHSLSLYKATVFDKFKLELRTGTIPVKQVYDSKHHIRISKFSSFETFTIPIILGNGLSYAERIIKGDDFIEASTATPDAQPDLTGMQCRWDRIPPPEDKEEIVTLLVTAREGQQQSEVFSKVMRKIDDIYGSPQKRQPISIAKLKLKTTFNKLGTEIDLRLGKVQGWTLVKTWFLTVIGKLYFRTSKGKNYLRSLVEMSDTLVIDGKINTVISGNAKQRAELQGFLDSAESDGLLSYGLHVSSSSVMSCYVRDMKDDHIHFVDGSEGGYTQAAIMLKGKMVNGE